MVKMKIPPSFNYKYIWNLYRKVIDGYENIPLLYISGPFTSVDKEEIDKLTKLASDVSIKAWEKGWSVISAHKNLMDYKVTDGMSYEKWLSGTIAQIARCDAILLLPGWEKSKGSIIEVKFACRHHIKVFSYEKKGIPEPFQSF